MMDHLLPAPLQKLHSVVVSGPLTELPPITAMLCIALSRPVPPQLGHISFESILISSSETLNSIGSRSNDSPIPFGIELFISFTQSPPIHYPCALLLLC